MSQNLVIANKDNLVVYVFGGIDLTLATNIQVQFGAESYSLANDPLIVIVTSATELSLNLSATLEVGKVFSTVTYFDGASVLGTDITSRELGNADQIVVAIGSPSARWEAKPPHRASLGYVARRQGGGTTESSSPPPRWPAGYRGGGVRGGGRSSSSA